MRRRDVTMGLGALAMSGCAVRSEGRGAPATGLRRPIVIAHRGASAERPEHTLAAYGLGCAQGADFIEPDLVPTKDGRLVCRHENEISGTTDVAAHPEFAGRRRTQVIDGETVTGWFTEDFTLAELKTLRCRERLPQLRPGNAAFDGQEAIPTFEELVAFAAGESARLGRPIGLYPELKHPAHFQAAGIDTASLLAQSVAAAGGQALADRLYVQCFETAPLVRLAAMSSLRFRLVQLMSANGGPADQPGQTYRAMATPSGLAQLRLAGVAGVGVEKALILPRDASGRSAAPTTFIADAHAAGLEVHAWTFRPENHFLPAELRQSENPTARGDGASEIRRFIELGIDGLFADLPAQAVAARDRT